MISTKEQWRVNAREWNKALKVLASLGVNVEFFTKDLTEERKPGIVSLSRALLALKKRRPQAWEEKESKS